MNRQLKRLLLGVGALALIVLAAFGPDVVARVTGLVPSNRNELARLKAGLSVGMTRAELERRVAGFQAPVVRHRWESDRELLVWAPVGFLENASFTIYLDGGKVASIKWDEQ
jgi:hypothetical protein